MPRKVRYLETQKNRETFSFHVTRIEYRDAKGRVSKFSKGKRLSIRAFVSREVFNKKRHRYEQQEKLMKKYSLPLRVRKKEPSIEQFNSRIKKRLAKEQKTLLMVMEEGITRFTYTFVKKKKTHRKKGSIRENKRIKKNPV